jgi:sterol 14-demethylase
MQKAGCNDIAEDQALLTKTLSLYEIDEKSYNSSSIIFPFAVKVLTPKFWKQIFASARLFFVFKAIIDKRKKLGSKGMRGCSI